jgi:hypothetical protein
MRNGWLVEHQSSREEIGKLLAVVARDLRDSQTTGLSPGWRLNIAYNAALMAAMAALAACGYRSAREAHHYRGIDSHSLTIGVDNSITTV